MNIKPKRQLYLNSKRFELKVNSSQEIIKRFDLILIFITLMPHLVV